MLPGQMMDRPLLISSILEYASRVFAWQRIAWRGGHGQIEQYTIREFDERVRRLATGLTDVLGVGDGERVATLAWTNQRHLELYFAIPGIGAVCHMLNPRYTDDQLIHIILHAENRIIFVDSELLPRLLRIIEYVPTVTKIVVLDDEVPAALRADVELLAYERLVLQSKPISAWPELHERAAAALCYTSGTTGAPRGVLYSHRALLLYALCGLAAGLNNMGPRTTALLCVPMFHVNAWAKPHQALIAGSKLVLPGMRLDGESLDTLIESEGVTVGFGVPTIWLGYLEHMRLQKRKSQSLRHLVIGGARATSGLLTALQDELDIRCDTGFGMTETTAGLALGSEAPDLADVDEASRSPLLARQRPIFGIETRIDTMGDAPSDADQGVRGELLCRGHFVAANYYRDEAATAEAITADGWLRTGDIVTVDSYGRLEVVDRAKDMIKSGGEWISSVELESQASLHPEVAEAAVIGILHPKWNERPLILIRRKNGSEIDEAAILDHLRGRVMRWWVPDACRFVDAIPRTGTGKIDKKELRAKFASWSYSQDSKLVQNAPAF